MAKTRGEELVDLRRLLETVRDPTAHLHDEKRSMPVSTENHVTAALQFVRDLLPAVDGDIRSQIEFLQEFEIFSHGLITHMVTAVNAMAVIHADSGDARSALQQAERVLTLFAEDIFNHALISQYREALQLDGEAKEPLSEYLKKSFCDLPFRHFETTYAGDAFLCCPSWVPLPAGNIFTQDPAEIWNSPSAKAIRHSILDGSYKYCSRVYCHLIQTRSLPARAVNPTLDRPHRDGSTVYRGYSIWVWNGRYLGVESEPPAETLADLTLEGVSSAPAGRYFPAERPEDIKLAIDQFLDRDEQEPVKTLEPTPSADELSAPELLSIIQLERPEPGFDTVTYQRRLSTEDVDCYSAGGLYYAVPRGEAVSAKSLQQRLNSRTIPAWNEASLKVLVGIFEQELAMDVHKRPFPHMEFMPRGPNHAAFSHDRSCNVSCPSCRVARFTASRSEQNIYDTAMPLLLSFLRGTDFITVTGGGDPFASRHYRELLKQLKDVSNAKIILHTNALLFDERAWTELKLAGRVAHATISIDAADEETYERIRRGSKWATLQERLKFISMLRRIDSIEFLETNFTVQKSNFRQMPQFARMALDLGFDKVKFSIVRNIGAYTTQQYEAENISSALHAEHNAFIEILDDPIFDHLNVDLANCSSYRRAKQLFDSSKGDPNSRAA